MNKLNPGYKLLTLVLASLLLSLHYNVPLYLLVACISFLVTICTPGVNRHRLLLAMIPFLLAALGMFTTGLIFADGSSAGVELSATGQAVVSAGNLTSAMQLSSRILAYGGLGMLFAFTTDSMELIMSLMQQFHLPAKFAYGILAAYHFFPVVRSEYATVGAALKVRGIHAGPFSTKRIFPMLVHALERSESLAMAMESRGFEDGVPRAVAFQIPLHGWDFAFLIGVNGLILAGMYFL